jgi:hypothetical protein
MPNNLDINTLETWLWDAACNIRGEISPLKYGYPIDALKNLMLADS